jgi:hypothetical protein
MKKTAKRARGRPELPAGERRRSIEFTLLQRDVDLAEVIGAGNRSRGIEIALRAYRKLAD